MKNKHPKSSQSLAIYKLLTSWPAHQDKYKLSLLHQLNIRLMAPLWVLQARVQQQKPPTIDQSFFVAANICVKKSLSKTQSCPPKNIFLSGLCPESLQPVEVTGHQKRSPICPLSPVANFAPLFISLSINEILQSFLKLSFILAKRSCTEQAIYGNLINTKISCNNLYSYSRFSCLNLSYISQLFKVTIIVTHEKNK